MRAQKKIVSYAARKRVFDHRTRQHAFMAESDEIMRAQMSNKYGLNELQ